MTQYVCTARHNSVREYILKKIMSFLLLFIVNIIIIFRPSLLNPSHSGLFPFLLTSISFTRKTSFFPCCVWFTQHLILSAYIHLPTAFLYMYAWKLHDLKKISSSLYENERKKAQNMKSETWLKSFLVTFGKTMLYSKKWK